MITTAYKIEIRSSSFFLNNLFVYTKNHLLLSYTITYICRNSPYHEEIALNLKPWQFIFIRLKIISHEK